MLHGIRPGTRNYEDMEYTYAWILETVYGQDPAFVQVETACMYIPYKSTTFNKVAAIEAEVQGTDLYVRCIPLDLYKAVENSRLHGCDLFL